MTVTDWAMAKEVWKVVKEADLDLHEGLMVYLGLGPDGTIRVQAGSAMDEEPTVRENLALWAEIESLRAKIRALTEDSRD